MTVKKLDIDLEDISGGVDISSTTELEKKLSKSANYSRAFLWIGVEFINNKKSHITVPQLANFLKKNRGYCYEILEYFKVISILNVVKKEGQVSKYVLVDGDAFNHYLDVAKKKVGLK